MKDQFNQSEEIFPAKDAARKNEIIEEMKATWGNPEYVIEEKERVSNYLKRLENVAKSADIKEIQTGLKQYFPETYHPFSPDGPNRPRKLTQEEIKQYNEAITDASIESIKKSGWAVLQLSGSDMDIHDYAITSNDLVELINKLLEEKGVPDKKVVQIHTYPIRRQTTGSRPGPSEPGFLMIETAEQEKVEK